MYPHPRPGITAARAPVSLPTSTRSPSPPSSPVRCEVELLLEVVEIRLSRKLLLLLWLLLLLVEVLEEHRSEHALILGSLTALTTLLLTLDGGIQHR